MESICLEKLNTQEMDTRVKNPKCDSNIQQIENFGSAHFTSALLGFAIYIRQAQTITLPPYTRNAAADSVPTTRRRRDHGKLQIGKLWWQAVVFSCLARLHRSQSWPIFKLQARWKLVLFSSSHSQSSESFCLALHSHTVLRTQHQIRSAPSNKLQKF